MAKFLNTKKAVSAIEDLIKDAGQTLILISPYLKLSKDFRELLTYRNSKDKITTVIFGKQELKPDEMKFLESLRFVILKYKDELHAKCYLNDEKMIITSLNLYDFSMANNKEMGVLIEKSNPNDLELFEEAFKEVDYINQTSERFAYRTQNAPTTTVNKFDNIDYNKGTSNNTKSDKPTGYCIRTGVEIPFNIEKPMSHEAFKVWSRFGDPDYPEKFCHFSGEPSNGETSVIRPILKKNWNKAKEIHGF
ncbi:PLD-like domain protein [uncultured archaeon]|nr:PLD-like domain protein [uncultured archaeon]